jgi:hypothetical protein
VQADNPAVAAHPEISLDPVGTLLPGKTEGGKGVFRRIARGAAMTNYHHT